MEQLAKLEGKIVPTPNYYQLETTWATAPDLYVPAHFNQNQLKTLIKSMLN